MGSLFAEVPPPPKRRKRSLLFAQLEEEEPFAVRIGRMLSEKRKPIPRLSSGLVPSDPVIQSIFAALQGAWASNNRKAEQEAWCRLMVRLKELPPPD